MTVDELARLRAIAEAATPGPYTWEHYGFPEDPEIMKSLKMIYLTHQGEKFYMPLASGKLPSMCHTFLVWVRSMMATL